MEVARLYGSFGKGFPDTYYSKIYPRCKREEKFSYHTELIIVPVIDNIY